MELLNVSNENGVIPEISDVQIEENGMTKLEPTGVDLTLDDVDDDSDVDDDFDE